MHKATISVIMGTYNPDFYCIKEAVDSIISQTFTDWELIIYDDGSCVTCAEKIKELSLADDRIIYLHSDKNRGLAHALNCCIEFATGEYIARMDDDDVSLPNRFQEQYDFLSENLDYDWVGSEAFLFDESGIWGKANRLEIPKKESFLHSSPFIHPSVMFRKSILEKCGGYNESKLCLRCEDYELFMRLYCDGYKGYNIQNNLIKYRESSTSLTRSFKYSINEMFIRINGFRKLGLKSIKSVAYVLKPLIVWMISFAPKVAQKIRLYWFGEDQIYSSFRKSANRKNYYLQNLTSVQNRVVPIENSFSQSGFVEYVLSPLIYFYSLWVLQNAKEDGVKKLYFLARDSYLPYLISKRICEKGNYDIECKYFYCSRYSLRVPMYSENILDAIEYVCSSGIDVTFRKILIRSGLNENRINNILKCFNDIDADKTISYVELSKIKDKLFRCEEYVEMLKEVSREKWDTTYAYFLQEGILEDNGIGIVDSGWVGTTQKSINDIRKRCGCSSEIEGYYFGLYEIPYGCNPQKYHSYYFGPKTNALNKIFFSNCFIEAILHENCGTTYGYIVDEGVEPVFANAVSEPVLDEICSVVVQYAEDVLNCKDVFKLNSKKCKKKLERSLRLFMWNPTEYEAETFGQIRFSDDLLDETTKEVAPILSEKFLLENHFVNRALVRLKIRNRVIHESAWYEASAVRKGNNSLWHRCSFVLYKMAKYIFKR